MQPTESNPRKTCNQLKLKFSGKAVRRGALVLGGAVALAAIPATADPYTFESLSSNTFIDGDDGWVDQAGQGQAVIALDDTGNGTVVVRHFQTTAFNQSAFITRVNDTNFSFIPFNGTGTLWFRNLTDGDTSFHTVSGLRDKPLGLLTMNPQAVPKRWNAMWIHLLTMGNRNPRADNLVPNANAIRIDDITRDGTNLMLHWQGGVGPYLVQSCPDPGTESWNDLGPTTEGFTATVPVTTGCGFFRVTKP